ncbi:MAG TPA: hypothetical protein ENJ00_02950 [Phycisphaerales bacterium]|nr:hypothetical protein [Phycisphaerales bacterium]
MIDFICKRGAVLALVAGSAMVGTASADISAVVFNITATTPSGSYPFEVMLDPGDVDANGNYHWALDGPVSVNDETGQQVFELQGADITIFADPSVSLNFNVLASQQNTVFSVNSAVLSFAALPNAIGRATAAVSVTDLNGDGATFTPTGAGAYSSFYNGATPFQDLIGNVITAPAFGSNADSAVFPNAGYANIGATLTDISSTWNFTLSAGDLASGTSEFEVIPAPASTVLGLIALAGLRRRR